MSDPEASAPLLAPGGPSTAPRPAHDAGPGPEPPAAADPLAARLARCRRRGRRLLDSRHKHFLVMAVVALDVVALLANVFIRLIACEMHQRREPWVLAVTEGLELAGLFFSSLFMLELAACLFSFGPR